MTQFDDRKKAFESMFAHNAEMTFKAAARRNKLLAHWAGDAIGYDKEETEVFAAELVKVDLSEQGSEDVFRLLREEFDKAHVEMSDHRVRRNMDEKMAEARQQLMDGV
jgi:hypothetical protein